LNKFKKEQNNAFFLTQQAVKDNEFIRNLKKQLKIAGSKSFYFANQQLNKDITEIRQLVIHLQTDLTAEKQDKEHIQEELDKALEILNKPKTEMGTQTDIE
jgi:hypothetical protein